MLNHKQSGISAILHEGKSFLSVYHLGVLVWQSVRSCFGSGEWKNDKPWLDDEAWKN